MKNLTKVLTIGAVLVAATPFAMADQISIGSGLNGGVTFSTTDVTFIAPFTVTGATGVFSGLDSASTVIVFPTPTLADSFDGTLPSAVEILTLTNGATASDAFYLTSLAAINANGENVYTDPTTGALDLGISGTGYFTGTNITGEQPVNFTFTSQGETTNSSTGNLTTVSFSATGLAVAPTPEPASLVLLGTGLLGIGGLLYTRRHHGSDLA